jgi:exonuclease VII small subunit
MWKKQEEPVNAPPEFDSKQMPESTFELNDEALMKTYRDHIAEKGKTEGNPQKISAKGQDQPLSAATMEAYTEAVNEFTRNATAFIEQLPLLTKARDAYERAMSASAEMRKVLDAGEGKVQTFMTQLEQVVNAHLGKSAGEKKKPEAVKVEPIRSEESAGVAKKFL